MAPNREFIHEVAAFALWLIRDQQVTTAGALASRIASKYNIPEGSAVTYAGEALGRLRSAGLIAGSNSAIVPTKLVRKVQDALGISLRELFGPAADTLKVRPLFGAPGVPAQRLDVFVLMPFAEPMRAIYDDHIKKVCEDLGVIAMRADDLFSAKSVVAEIWAAVNRCRIVVADCTGRNSNVFYEIGIAHTIGRTVILLSQENGDVPFDLAHIRYIQYAYTPRGMTALERTLRATLITELDIARGV